MKALFCVVGLCTCGIGACQGFPRSWDTPEQALSTLRSDQATPDDWCNAADVLVAPTDARRVRSGLVSPQYLVSLPEVTKLGPVCPLAGEPLRIEHGAEITELLSRRALECCAPRNVPNSVPEFDAVDGIGIAIDLAKWEGKSALPTLKRVTEQSFALNSPFPYSNLNTEIVRGIDWRLMLGDDSSLDLYAKFINTFSPKEIFYEWLAAPLWRRNDDSKVAHFTQRIFSDPNGRWNAASIATGVGLSEMVNLISSPLVKVSGFRDPAMQLLENRSVFGNLKIWVEDDGWVRYGDEHGGQGSLASRPDGPPLVRGPQPLRICDLIANAFAGVKGSPKFDGGASAEVRDGEIRKMEKFLIANGDHLETFHPDPQRYWP